MATASVDIYFFPPSPPSRAALLLIHALGLLPNIKLVNIMKGEQHSPEFLKLNPLHTIPVINDTGFVLYDSHVIMQYLTDKYAKDDSLYPKDLQKRAVVNQRLFYDSIYLFPRFVQYFFGSIMSGKPPTEEDTKKFNDSLLGLNMFLDGKPWIAGEQMTIADFSIISIISTVDACNSDLLTPYPNVKNWFEKAKENMSGFDYENVMKTGANVFADVYKSAKAKNGES